MTLVSIVTPSYNQAAYLEQTIRSVLGQDHRELEYLIVDGGSTDGSVEIIKRYAPQLAWSASEKDSGQAEAINKGMQRASGEIVVWLNSDDMYLPGAVAAAVQAFAEHPQAVLVYGDMRAVDGENRTINLLRYRQLSLEDLLCFQIIGQPAVFMRRVAFEAAGGLNPAFHFMLDHQLWIKIAPAGRDRSRGTVMGGGALPCAGEEPRTGHGLCAGGPERAGLGGKRAEPGGPLPARGAAGQGPRHNASTLATCWTMGRHGRR